jgi:SAM-dependent methyltransferase
MEQEEYATLFGLETSYWWFRGLRSFITDAFLSAGVVPGQRFLDAGCGTGQTLVELGQTLSTVSYGFDLSPHAASYWPRRGLSRICRGSINEIPYADASFDAVVSVDVLESDGVNERKAIAELWRVTRPGGLLALVVPAYSWLKTESHHRAVHASRRYTRAAVTSLLQERPLRILRLTHLFATVFPPVAAFRILLRCLGGRPANPRSELSALPPWLNGLLATLMQCERRLLRHADMPVGSSILAIARREVF